MDFIVKARVKDGEGIVIYETEYHSLNHQKINKTGVLDRITQDSEDNYFVVLGNVDPIAIPKNNIITITVKEK